MTTESINVKKINLDEDLITLSLDEEKSKETEAVIMFFYKNEDYIFGEHTNALINIPIDKRITAHARLLTFSNTNRAAIKIPVDLTKEKKKYECELVINDYDNEQVLKANMTIEIV